MTWIVQNTRKRAFNSRNNLVNKKRCDGVCYVILVDNFDVIEIKISVTIMCACRNCALVNSVVKIGVGT